MNFDYTYCNVFSCPQLYQINVFSSIKSLEIAYSRLKGNEKTQDEVNASLLEAIYNEFPLRIEGYEALYERS